MPSIGTDAEVLCTEASLIQNLGDDPLYVHDTVDVDDSVGIEVVAGKSVAVGGGVTFYGVSGGTSDVRVLGRGIGIYDVASA